MRNPVVWELNRYGAALGAPIPIDPISVAGVSSRADAAEWRLVGTVGRGLPWDPYVLGSQAIRSSTVGGGSQTRLGGCVTPDPFVAFGGSVCFDGGWLPPGVLAPGNVDHILRRVLDPRSFPRAWWRPLHQWRLVPTLCAVAFTDPVADAYTDSNADTWRMHDTGSVRGARRRHVRERRMVPAWHGRTRAAAATNASAGWLPHARSVCCARRWSMH